MFQRLAQVDELCSLAGFAFQHPEAAFPEIVTKGFLVQGKSLKHPFIDPAVCVGNEVNIDGWSRFHVITGANMAGKSTYLRTVGINYVLAMTGFWTKYCAEPIQKTSKKVPKPCSGSLFVSGLPDSLLRTI